MFSSTGDEAMGCALPSARCCIVSRKLPIAPALRSLDGPSSNGVLLTGAETRSRELPFAPALRSLDGPSSNGELLTGAETKIDHMAFCTIISNARRRSRNGWCPFWFLLSKHAQSMPSNSENIPRWSLERGGRCALRTPDSASMRPYLKPYCPPVIYFCNVYCNC